MSRTKAERAPEREAAAPPAGIPARIADQIRELVASGRFAPGLRLGQVELAEQFDASRMAAREALKLLSAEGMVVHDPNRGFFVAALSSDEARQLFLLRGLMETELLSNMRWPTREEVADLRRRAHELETMLNTGDRSAWWRRHREFHRAIFELSNDKIIVREAMRLWALTDRYRSFIGLPKRASAERSVLNKHDLVEALADRDRDSLIAARAHRRHLFEELVLETLSRRGL
ncbi:MAG: GntR family transcriptional regulator [Hyphomonadaceae bacterium]|nr:GntR family transcriptional regulator [Hyphomonadaceae bacterium]